MQTEYTDHEPTQPSGNRYRRWRWAAQASTLWVGRVLTVICAASDSECQRAVERRPVPRRTHAPRVSDTRRDGDDSRQVPRVRRVHALHGEPDFPEPNASGVFAFSSPRRHRFQPTTVPTSPAGLPESWSQSLSCRSAAERRRERGYTDISSNSPRSGRPATAARPATGCVGHRSGGGTAGSWRCDRDHQTLRRRREKPPERGRQRRSDRASDGDSPGSLLADPGVGHPRLRRQLQRGQPGTGHDHLAAGGRPGGLPGSGALRGERCTGRPPLWLDSRLSDSLRRGRQPPT